MEETKLKLNSGFVSNDSFQSMISPRKPRTFKGYPFFIAFIVKPDLKMYQ